MTKKIGIILLSVIIISFTAIPAFALSVGDTVTVGGNAFGIKFYTEGVLICGVSDVDTSNGNISPGKIADLKKGDIIKALNGKNVCEVNEITDIVKSSSGNRLSMTVVRNGEEKSIDIEPLISQSEGIYKLGLWIKDGTAGIGTLTYIDDSNGKFAGLGHGVCDIETGQLMSMRQGIVCDVTISSVKAGEKGIPGELQGFFSDIDIGILSKNSEQGVFGILNTSLPSSQLKAVIASRQEVNEGTAYILCTLDDNVISKYNIEIEKINNTNADTKNFIIKVTDTELIEKTGGIVQGMSGSPIIQNGKLIGAVTHVLVDDPTRGYGIFIENMLV